MPPKRSFSDDYGPPSDHNPSIFPPKRRKTIPANEWRRPLAPQEWWTVPEAEWDRMQPAMKMNWTHVGRIMETEEGEPAPAPCEQCVQAGVARQCWVYSREAMRRYGFKTHVCAKCRATANVCSLNPFFRNNVGLRNNNHPPPQSPSPWLGDGGHRYTSPAPDKRYRSPTPPSERQHRAYPPSPAQRHRFPSPSERERFPPIHPDRLPPEGHRSATPPHRRLPPHMPPPDRPALSLDSLASRLEVLEEQMDHMRKESSRLTDENGFLRWRLAELEAPDDEETKPPPPLTTEQSAVESLVMEESIASSLREKEQEQEQEQRDKVVEEVQEAERQRRLEEEEREQRWAAEFETLRDENAALTRRVLELEKGHEITQQIFRDMYYALDG